MRLIVNIDGEKPKTVDITEEVFTIGRSPKNSMQIESDSISRSHIRMRSANGVIYITDLGSANGTFINSDKLKPDEEVAWHTFFPISLGEKVSIAFETAQDTTVSTPSTPSRPSERSGKTQTKIEKAKSKPEKLGKTESKSSAIKPLYVGILLTIGMGYFFFEYYKDKEFQATDLTHTPKKSNAAANPKSAPELLQIPDSLKDGNKCQGDRERLFCNTLKLNPQNSEGTVEKNKDLYVFMNFGLRLKNVELDPSFSMASDQNRMTYLMTYLAFREDIRGAIKQFGYENLIIVDVATAPTRVNQVMKVSQINLLKLTSTDIQTFFAGVLNKDPNFFNSMMLPLVEMGYAK